jgi:hypothetical protein
MASQDLGDGDRQAALRVASLVAFAVTRWAAVITIYTGAPAVLFHWLAAFHPATSLAPSC